MYSELQKCWNKNIIYWEKIAPLAPWLFTPMVKLHLRNIIETFTAILFFYFIFILFLFYFILFLAEYYVKFTIGENFVYKPMRLELLKTSDSKVPNLLNG